MDLLEKVTLDEPEKFTYINSLLTNEEREQLVLVLLNNIDGFTWSHSCKTREKSNFSGKKGKTVIYRYITS